jgi:quercetin dioxygenase-like cupin family protein
MSRGPEVIMRPSVKRWIPVAAVCALGLALVLLVRHSGGAAPSEAEEAGGRTIAQRESAVSVVQSFDKAEEVKYPWGWIRWLMSSKIDPKAEMTLGIVYVKANQKNPLHLHPNCSEYLHVLSGSCEHLIGDKWFTLKAGDTIRIPKGVPHVARTFDQPMRAVIVYNSGDRQFEPVGGGEKE